MRRVLVLLAAVAAFLPGAPAAQASTVTRYAIPVGSETAFGWLAEPATTTPTKLLVFGHGCCGKPDQSAFVKSYADTYGAVAVAMDYRGPGRWDVVKGAEDLVAATLDLQAKYPSITRTVLWGVSMGGETTGLAVAARPDLFDYWVDSFGVTDLLQEWAVLGLYPTVSANPNDPNNPTRSWIAEGVGGTPATNPQAYVALSPLHHAAEMKGITRAYIAHGIGDLIVPYSESRAMYEALVAQGVPVSLTTVLTRPGNAQGPIVPASGVPPLPAQTPYGLSAHESSASNVSVAVVRQLLLGNEPDAGTAFRETVLDRTTGQTVPIG